MNKKLQKAFHQSEATKAKLFAIVSQYSEEQQRFRPSEKEWSMLDVVEHLAMSEAGINKLFLKYPPNQGTKVITIKDDLTSWLFHIFFLLPTKVKAPKFLKPPQSELSLKEWSIKWNKERALFEKTVENLNDSQLKMMVFKHPAAGSMSMYHTILFLTNHIKHHLHQIKRIAKSKGFPK